ncbi:MAG: alpha/beta hydrolase [Fidelibacterota bacterium]
MASLRSKLLLFMLRHKDFFKAKSKRLTRIDTVEDIYRFREIVEKEAEKFAKLPKDLKVEPIDIEGLYAEWLKIDHSPVKRAILYFHGGGLVSGSAKSHRGIVAKFVKATGINALTFDYALAPEHPYPAGLNDALKAYGILLEIVKDSQNILLMGDSGGGNLVLALLLLLKQKSIALPAGAITLSAWTDLTNSGESNITNRPVDKLTIENANEIFSTAYCNGKDPKDPLISPLFGDLSGLPPLLMFAGDDEVMRDDTVRFARKAKEAGVTVQVEVKEGMFHCYPAVAPLIPEANDAMDKIISFVNQQL